MPAVSFADLRDNLADHFDRIEAERTELVVTRDDHQPMVVMALSEWQGVQETLHLLGSPANAERLLASIDELDAGKGEVRDLVEE